MKDDIIAALLLHPECEECLSLIARVFPGKTAQELMHSHEASTVSAKLDTEMRRVAKLYTQVSDKSSSPGAISPIASQHLEVIELKIAESAEEKSISVSRTCLAVPSLGQTAAKLHFKSHGSLSAKSASGSRATCTSTKSRKSSADKKEATVKIVAKGTEEIEQEEEDSSQPCN